MGSENPDGSPSWRGERVGLLEHEQPDDELTSRERRTLMTLLLGARGRNHVVLIADGLSLRGEKEKLEVNDTMLTKLFAVADLPVAFAQYGENRFGVLPVETLLSQKSFERTIVRSWKRGLNHAIAKTITELDESISQTLKSHPQRTLSGLWLAGLWPCTDLPEIVEVYWKKLPPNRVRVAVKPLGDLVMGGSGAQFLSEYLKKPIDKKFSFEKIMKEPPEYSMELLKKLYAIAKEHQQQKKQQVFGGTAMMALITKDGVDLGEV